MVFYFTSTVVSPPITLFVGIDKYENEELIKWGWPEDVWFHVDKLSSAHVYLRLHPGQTIDDIPSAVLEDCAQLVKANSIQGNKMNNLEVVYTMWSNLKKTPGMEPGQVAFHKDKEHPMAILRERKGSVTKEVYKIRVEKRINEIVNRLNKTKEAKEFDFRAAREARDAAEREDKKRLQREQRDREKEDEKRRKEEAELRSYDRLLKVDGMGSNKDGNDSDDFM